MYRQIYLQYIWGWEEGGGGGLFEISILPVARRRIFLYGGTVGPSCDEGKGGKELSLDPFLKVSVWPKFCMFLQVM